MLEQAAAARAARLSAAQTLRSSLAETRVRLDVIVDEMRLDASSGAAVQHTEQAAEEAVAAEEAAAAAQHASFEAEEAAATRALSACRAERERLERAVEMCAENLRGDVSTLEAALQKHATAPRAALQHVESSMLSARRRLDVATGALQERSVNPHAAIALREDSRK